MSQVTMDELKYFWMPSGVPCFLADRFDICDIVEDMGFQIYYLLANDIKETKPASNQANNQSWQSKTYTYTINSGNAVTYGYTPPAPPEPTVVKETKLFKIVNNFVGRSIAISQDPLPDEFVSITETCEYTMPEIPNVIVEKLDQFFRLVYSQHGTESIVILTYNTNMTGPEGWGVLVPDQTNTPAHCKYDADSVAELKPEDVVIVGSVHSHPEMSAYASGTDHADQADFDGLHITYGWQKSQNNGATQYHIELQMAGQHYALKPEDVFEDITFLKDPDPDVIEWSNKVKKVHPPYTAGAPSRPTPTLTPYTANPSPHTAAVGEYKPVSYQYGRMAQKTIDKLGLPDNSLIVVEIQLDSDQKSECPCCDYEIDRHDVSAGACTICDIPVVLATDNINIMCGKIHRFVSDRKIDNISFVYLWGHDEKDTKDFLINITEEYEFHYPRKNNDYLANHPNVQLYQSSHWDYWRDNDDDEYDQNAHTARTVCCNVPVSNAYAFCDCSPMILKEDLLDFEDRANKSDFDIYDYDGNCVNCIYWQTVECPPYRDLITEFVADKAKFVLDESRSKITECPKFKQEAYLFGSASVQRKPSLDIPQGPITSTNAENTT